MDWREAAHHCGPVGNDALDHRVSRDSTATLHNMKDPPSPGRLHKTLLNHKPPCPPHDLTA